MKLSIGNKLFASGFIVLLLIVLMIIASQIVAGLFKNTSNKLVIEYNELNAVEEFKMSLSNLLISTSNYAIYGNENEDDYFDLLLHQSEEKLAVCKGVLTESHDLLVLKGFTNLIADVDSLGHIMFSLKVPDDQTGINTTLSLISKRINDGIINVDDLLLETKTEIEEYIEINNTVINHSTITILSLGLIVALFLLFGGWFFIRSLTRPINELVTITNKISSGDRKAKVNINTQDEFNTLAESFNKMVDNLEETTVSKNYLNNILKNMFDPLIVTDEHMRIQSINHATSELLGYGMKELTGQPVGTLFIKSSFHKSNFDNQFNDIKIEAANIKKADYIYSKSGNRLPAMISSSKLKNEEGRTIGLVIVCHDLTEKHTIEEKLERSRKNRLIDINEAQEEERIRIATDLHDGLGQMLTAISYAVQDLSPHKEFGTRDVFEPIVKIQEQIDKAISEAKNLAHNLIPILLNDFGLVVAVENLIERANEIHKTRFRFDAFDFNERIDPKREKVLYRVCQESLNNILKHAKAENASYQVFWQDCSVVLVIEDDGVGFDLNAIKLQNRGIGLISMRERVLAFDGDFTINTQPGEGTEILVELPCPKEI